MIAILLLSILSTLLTIALVVLLVVFLVKRAKKENKIVVPSSSKTSIGLSYKKTSNKGVNKIMDDISELFDYFQTETCKALNLPEAKKEFEKIFDETMDNVGEETNCTESIKYIKEAMEPEIKALILKMEKSENIPPGINKDFIVDKITSIVVQSIKSSCVDNKIKKEKVKEFITQLNNALCH
jgi:hypothetical protein